MAIRFAADVHLAKLARHLRMVGIDCDWKDDWSDDALLEETSRGATLLTKDRALYERARAELAHSVVANDPFEQLAEVLQRFSLMEYAKSHKGFLTRCLQCNTTILPVKAGMIADRVPANLLQEFQEFFLCPRCERVYWKGSHWERMKELVEKL